MSFQLIDTKWLLLPTCKLLIVEISTNCIWKKSLKVQEIFPMFILLIFSEKLIQVLSCIGLFLLFSEQSPSFFRETLISGVWVLYRREIVSYDRLRAVFKYFGIAV